MRAPKKRSLEAMQGQDCRDIGLQTKRSMFGQRQDSVHSSLEFKLPEQQELGHFWISTEQSTHCKVQQEQESYMDRKHPCRSSWDEDQMSISLAQHCHGPRAEEDLDCDIQDTAISSGASDSGSDCSTQPAQHPTHDSKAYGISHDVKCATAQHTQACHTTGEDDSITSADQRGTLAPAAYPVKLSSDSNSKSSTDPDASRLYCWEVLHTVLHDM